jgi:2-amino-4-hydroxy-6-hydroxymethyldihydropteridine diphosphokinase
MAARSQNSKRAACPDPLFLSPCFLKMRTGIGLGSNIGDRLATLRAARDAILTLPGVLPPILLPPVFESEAVDCEPGTPPFLNTVMEFEYTEASLGRPSKHPRNVSRSIDLDILYVGNLSLHNEEIVIPHPRLPLRRFVLAPLAAIRPDLVLPGQGESVSALLAGLPDDGAMRRWAESW